MPPYHIALTLMIFFSSRNFPTTVNLDTDGSYSRSYSIENKQKSINHCVIICTACILSRSGRFQAEIRTGENTVCTIVHDGKMSMHNDCQSYLCPNQKNKP